MEERTTSHGPFLKSFSHAFRGISEASRGRNFKVQATIGVIVLFFSFLFQISHTKLAVIILTITFVLAMETSNTAVEEICNKFHPEIHPHIKLIKDLAAGAVLIASIGAVAVGIVILAPYFALYF